MIISTRPAEVLLKLGMCDFELSQMKDDQPTKILQNLDQTRLHKVNLMRNHVRCLVGPGMFPWSGTHTWAEDVQTKQDCEKDLLDSAKKLLR